jgi:hypothetical protein
MKLFRVSLLCLAAALCGSVSAIAQEKKAKKAPVSPPAVATATVGGNEISIKYAQPGIKDPKTGQPRKIWGGLVPYGKVWRTGANAATTLTLAKPIVIGGFNLGRGQVHAVHGADGGRGLETHHQQAHRPVGHSLQGG